MPWTLQARLAELGQVFCPVQREEDTAFQPVPFQMYTEATPPVPKRHSSLTYTYCVFERINIGRILRLMS